MIISDGREGTAKRAVKRDSGERMGSSGGIQRLGVVEVRALRAQYVKKVCGAAAIETIR
jgi:hypothetical protein